jgi:hypothetical protein
MGGGRGRPTEILRKLEHRGEILLVACDRIFHEMGGFADIPIMEDIEFSRRLRRMGRIALVDPPLWSSPEALPQFGQRAHSLLNALFIVLFYLGVSPDKLHC